MSFRHMSKKGRSSNPPISHERLRQGPLSLLPLLGILQKHIEDPNLFISQQ